MTWRIRPTAWGRFPVPPKMGNRLTEAKNFLRNFISSTYITSISSKLERQWYTIHYHLSKTQKNIFLSPPQQDTPLTLPNISKPKDLHSHRFVPRAAFYHWDSLRKVWRHNQWTQRHEPTERTSRPYLRSSRVFALTKVSWYISSKMKQCEEENPSQQKKGIWRHKGWWKFVSKSLSWDKCHL